MKRKFDLLRTYPYYQPPNNDNKILVIFAKYIVDNFDDSKSAQSFETYVKRYKQKNTY